MPTRGHSACRFTGVMKHEALTARYTTPEAALEWEEEQRRQGKPTGP